MYTTICMYYLYTYSLCCYVGCVASPASASAGATPDLPTHNIQSTPNSHHKIQVFSDPTLGKSCAAVKLPIKRTFVLGNLTLGKSIVRENMC